MTPERLAEIERLAKSPNFRSVRYEAGIPLGPGRNLFDNETVADLIAHIRDLEAQVREAREALSLAYLELGDGAHPGFREANRAAMAVYERYFDHHDPTGKTIHELRDALATATPPSPEEE